MKHHILFKPQQEVIAPPPAPVAGTDKNEINFAPSPDEVARKAYFAFENQGSQPGHEVQHWLKAEADLIAERNLTRVPVFIIRHKKFANLNRINFMKVHANKLKAKSQTPVFPQTLHTVRPSQEKPLPNPKRKKRDNIFSKSRDVREDRGTREIKTSHNDQSFHAR